MISVVIPAYNSVKSIRRAIDSVLAQTYHDYEIIVVDDGSTDGTGEVVKRYGQRVNYMYQENSGVCVARNVGIEAAKGQWIAFMDHDDEWAPEKLERQMQIVSENHSLKWCSVNYFQNDGVRCTPVSNPETVTAILSGSDYFESYFQAAGKKIIRIMPTTILIHTEVFDKVGGFNAKLLRNEDTDLWCRIGLHYRQIGYIAQPLATRYLDVSVPKTVSKLRIEQRTGQHMRGILAQYLKVAEELGCSEEYKLFAAISAHSKP